MYPCGNCRAAAVGPDGRCAACGTYQQQLSQAPAPPAGPAPYPAPAMGMPAAGADLRRGLSTTLQVLLGIVALAFLGALIARFHQWSLAGDAMDGEPVTMAEADDADDTFGAMLLLSMLAWIGPAIAWPMWFHRMRRNAEVFAPGQHRLSTGWAAGSWFTPVVSLWFPKQIANDIWRASSPHGPQQAPTGLLNAWWVCWIGGVNLFGVTFGWYSNAHEKVEDNLFGDDDVLKEAHNAMFSNVIALGVMVAAAVLAILLVRRLTAMQEQRASLPPQGGPAPYGAPNPYGAASPYGQPGAAPYGQPGAAPYGQPGAAPYGQPGPAPYGQPGSQPGAYPPPPGPGPAGY
ncbi:DUF4328 domain-containing protein [Streptomyces sp. XD-27]|uniref:DUF4328 domain-containing protein n=1 Tax=Streptomyces sp. XD-27 TaxID=3062779 RepID=UPI0026F41559|nr:DUF4328 domain-containing protein [Streptomyces sp. XD-27]WKX70825.1 DUF4328 domain-containing protein [Streptomyces sp. XD-27]